MPIAGEMFLPLDATKHAVTNPSRPMYFFLPQVLGVALGHLRSLRAGHELGAELVAGAEDVGSVVLVIFSDPDRNLRMVCQQNG
jgi:hypothetical protein